MNTFLYLLLCPVFVFSQNSLDTVASLFQKKEYKQAERLITAYLKNHPNHLKGIELLGDAYGHQEQWDAAIYSYKKLVEANATNANYHYKYAGVLGMKALQNKFKAIGFIGDIKNHFIKAAELDPNHMDARWALVELYMQLPGIFGGSKSKSLHYAQELENLSRLEGYLAKGYIYEYDNQPELAEKHYKMAIQERGTLHRNALQYQIGKVAAEYNIELQKGEQCLHTYIKNYSAKDGVPKAWAYYRLAQINRHKKNKEEALKHINLALAELPKIKPFKEEKEKILSM